MRALFQQAWGEQLKDGGSNLSAQENTNTELHLNTFALFWRFDEAIFNPNNSKVLLNTMTVFRFYLI